jgi:hypothetical protein
VLPKLEQFIKEREFVNNVPLQPSLGMSSPSVGSALNPPQPKT